MRLSNGLVRVGSMIISRIDVNKPAAAAMAVLCRSLLPHKVCRIKVGLKLHGYDCV
jgi:hypothetical protein